MLRNGCVLLVGLFAWLAFALPASAASGLELAASVDGHPLATSSESHPVRLSPTKPATLDLTITNNGASTVDIRTVRLEGRVVGLTFFAYDTSVSFTVAPGTTTHLQYALDLTGLDGQATGLIPGSVRLLDSRRHLLASQGMVADVRGSIKSVYGLFGVALFVLTALAALGALLALARHRLSPNRWLRAARFLTPGLGLGLVLVFTVSAFRIWVPTTGKWIVMILVCGAIFFGIGYLTPTPVTEDDDEDDAEEWGASDPAPAATGAQPGRMPGAPG